MAKPQKHALLPVYDAVREYAKKCGAKPGQVFVRELAGGWGVAVNLASAEKRAVFGGLSMGVGLKPGAVAVWRTEWLVGVVMESGGTWLPRDKDSTADNLLAVIAATKGSGS